MNRLLNIILIFFILTVSVYGQKSDQREKRKMIRFTGQVLTSDSLTPLPYTSIYIKNIYKGSIADINGFFSFNAATGDTIIFSRVGFIDAQFVIPDTLKSNSYTTIQLMTHDTIFLAETVIYPWPTWELFKEAFIKNDVPDDDLERAKKNLERERLKELGETMAMDARENADFYFKQQAASLYSAGQYPSIQLLNPFAWSKFIEAWKKGDFKRKKKK